MLYFQIVKRFLINKSNFKTAGGLSATETLHYHVHLSSHFSYSSEGKVLHDQTLRSILFKFLHCILETPG